jgi:hypothetical protein
MTVGDLDGNASKMAEWAARATSAGAAVVLESGVHVR